MSIEQWFTHHLLSPMLESHKCEMDVHSQRTYGTFWKYLCDDEQLTLFSVCSGELTIDARTYATNIFIGSHRPILYSTFFVLEAILYYIKSWRYHRVLGKAQNWVEVKWFVLFFVSSTMFYQSLIDDWTMNFQFDAHDCFTVFFSTF